MILLTHDKFGVIKLVRRHFKVERVGSLSNASRGIVVRSVARAKPAAKFTSAGNWHAAQVSAHTQQDQPVKGGGGGGNRGGIK